MDDWKAYLGGDKGKCPDIRISGLLDKDHTAEDLVQLERDRFRWILHLYSDNPNHLFTLWTDGDFMLDERKALKGLELQQFYGDSSALCSLLLRKEVRNLASLRQLRDSIRCRIKGGDPVLYFGPTSGAELEAITAAGGFPILVTDQEGAKWENQMEARLITDCIPFEVCSIANRESSIAVISPWITDARATVSQAVNLLGLYGFLIHSFTNLSLGYEIKKLNLRPVDTHQTQLGVWFKPPSHTGIGVK